MPACVYFLEHEGGRVASLIQNRTCQQLRKGSRAEDGDTGGVERERRGEKARPPAREELEVRQADYPIGAESLFSDGRGGRRRRRRGVKDTLSPRKETLPSVGKFPAAAGASIVDPPPTFTDQPPPPTSPHPRKERERSPCSRCGGWSNKDGWVIETLQQLLRSTAPAPHFNPVRPS